MAAARSETRRKIRPVQIIGDIAVVPLTRGLVAIIDAADVAIAAPFNWYAHVSATSGPYAARWGRAGEDAVVYLHRVIGDPAPGEGVDHANGCGLDDRRANIRTCTRSQNGANSHGRPNKTGLKGVWERNGAYRASIQFGGKTTHFGPFKTAEEAAAAYARAARQAFGEFARHDA